MPGPSPYQRTASSIDRRSVRRFLPCELLPPKVPPATPAAPQPQSVPLKIASSSCKTSSQVLPNTNVSTGSKIPGSIRLDGTAAALAAELIEWCLLPSILYPNSVWAMSRYTPLWAARITVFSKIRLSARSIKQKGPLLLFRLSPVFPGKYNWFTTYFYTAFLLDRELV